MIYFSIPICSLGSMQILLLFESTLFSNIGFSLLSLSYFLMRFSILIIKLFCWFLTEFSVFNFLEGLDELIGIYKRFESFEFDLCLLECLIVASISSSSYFNYISHCLIHFCCSFNNTSLITVYWNSFCIMCWSFCPM